MKKKIQLEGMSCGHCVSHVTEALQALDHTTDIQVELGTQSVILETEASEELIRQAIDDAGYTVLGIE